MSRPFAVFDIDGTIIRWQLFHAITDALAKDKALPPRLYAQIQQARQRWKTRTHEESFKEYEHQLVDNFKTVLKGMDVAAHKRASQAVFEEYKDQVYRYTRGLITELKAKGYVLFAISGSPTDVVEPFASYYGVDDFVSTRYMSSGSTYTGESEVFLGRKDQALDMLVKKHGLNYKDSIAVGDSEGDIAMLGAVENPIAFNPSKILLAEAKAKGWKIVVERKNVIYELSKQNGVYILENQPDGN
ncbi:MAG: HAD family hydrolase [Candidatus Saccharimonadales bacterium]